METFAHYQLIHRLALGSWSELWLAQDIHAPDAPSVVVKRLLPSMARRKDAIRQLKSEAQIAHNFQHANVVHTSLPHESAQGHWYLTMPYHPSMSLQAVIAAANERKLLIPEPLRVFIAAETAAGLTHIHGRYGLESSRHLGVVHCDLTPANLLIGFDGRVRVSDFGCALTFRDRGRSERSRMGTTTYMSPEQVLSTHVDHRSDHYALGVILWELLAGKRLYDGIADFQVMTRTVEKMPPRPPTKNAQLARIVLRCLQKEADRRFGKTSELCDQLYDHVQGTRELVRGELSAWMTELRRAD